MSDQGDEFESERTRILPNPSGRRTLAPKPDSGPVQTDAPSDASRQASEDPPGAPRSSPSLDLALTGTNRLTAAAATLFSLVARLRGRRQLRDVDGLRAGVISEIQAFAQRATRQGVDERDVRVARYAISATIDDVVLNTPWGEAANWARQGMVVTFHKEAVGGERMYDLIDRLLQDRDKNIDLVEFLYMSLALGFEGRFRVEDGGRDQHADYRNRLASAITQVRGASETGLSPRWPGVEAPQIARSLFLPVWITAGALAALLVGAFLSFSFALSGRATELNATLVEVTQTAPAELARRAPPPPPPPPPPPERIELRDKIETFLAPEIAARLVTLREDGSLITIRLASQADGRPMFSSGSDRPNEAFLPVIQKIAEALNEESGPIIVAGYTDNIPPGRTARFSSNEELSFARARAVMDRMAANIADPVRMSAEGRGPARPVATNKTAEGRALNRRVEIEFINTSQD